MQVFSHRSYFVTPKRATLPLASAALNSVSYRYHCFYPSSSTLPPSFWSYASGFMLKKTQGGSLFHMPVDPVQLLLTTSSQALILKHWIPIHKIIITMMLLR